MRSRRFLLLAALLVTLNVALWVVPQGLATQQTPISVLFGKSMMRADVVENTGAEWRVDRGTVVTNVAGVLTLHEVDSKIQAIALSSSTRIIGASKAIKPGWRVVVSWPAPNGPADTVIVEKK